LWVRSDFGGNATGTIQVMLATTAWTAFFQWNYASLNANQWYRLVVPLAHSTSKTGSPNLNNIAALQVNSVGKASVASNLWVDEISLDVGILVPLEFQIPDAVSQTTQYPIVVQSWNGSSYLTFSEESAQGDTVQNPNNISYLDGSTSAQLFPAGSWSGTYPPGAIGVSVQDSQGHTTLVYTTTYGTNERFVNKVKMSPATSDSNSGSYPSNDLTGFQAINKVRLKVQVYYSSEETSYSGFT
ncbi:MAG: hypothetical protein ACRECH_10765, partial [Nitrososphaerales archaeon]